MARRLLLADDSITIQKVVELVLAEEDFDIKSVSDGEAAMKLLDSFKPDIVLADIEMPKVNGYQLCENIKKNPNTSATPVILLAGAFEPIDLDLAKKVGADDSVIKPFESQELISKINAVITMGSAGGFEAEAFAVEETDEEVFELGEELETEVQPETAEAVSAETAEEDLWAMEDITETPDEFAAEALTDEEVSAAEVFAEPQPEIAVEEEPRVSQPLQPAPFAAPAAERKEVAVSEIVVPSKEEILSMIEKKLDEKISTMCSSIDIREALLTAATPMIRETIEKILWEIAPELVERVTKETLKGAFASVSSEVEKVLWETVPELAGTMISKEIEKIRSEF